MSNLVIEKELVEKLRQGNEMAFEIIFHRSKDKLKGFLLKVLPFGEDVESMIQEIYLKIWSNRKTINRSLNFENYIYTIARNMVIDVIRKKYSKQKCLNQLYNEIKEDGGNLIDPHKIMQYSELETKIFDLIEKLPERRKLIFKLNKIEDFTYREIAQKLCISENTVDSQMRSALAFLRKEIKSIL